MDKYPIKFIAQERRALWGRELWVVSGHPVQPSIAANGPYAGRTLPDMVEEFGADMVGAKATCVERFPLLVKVIEANDRLSLQVHPNEETAKLSGGEPKTEMWYVLDCAPGACIFAGLREGVGRDSLVRALHGGGVEGVVVRFEVRRGDVLFIPGGLVHAVGGGCRLFEVQQTSDTTWRLHDWDRVDPRTGQQRKLNEREGLAAIDWSLPPPTLLRGLPSPRNPLIDCPQFRFSVLDIASTRFLTADEDSFRLLFASEGECKLIADGSLPISLSRNECALLPAGLPCSVVPAPSCRLLVSGC